MISPVRARSGRAGVVLVHGAGTGTKREKLLGEAVAFARQGLSVLIYDKRSEGYSLFERSYSQLADDALGAVGMLRQQPGVDPAKVGIWGLSEGGWVAPLAASRSKDISFVILVGANALQPLRQQTWAVAAGLRKAGVHGSFVDRTEPTMYRVIADGGLFPEPYYDPEPVIGRVRQPVLGIWGVHDLLTPPRETPPIFAKALEKGGNRRYTFRFFADADHAAHRTPDGGVTRLPELAPGYAELVGSWVGEATSGRAPVAQVTGPAPVQADDTVAVPPADWWESASVQVAVLMLFLVAFGGYPVVALVRRVRRRGGALSAKNARRGGVLLANEARPGEVSPVEGARQGGVLPAKEARRGGALLADEARRDEASPVEGVRPGEVRPIKGAWLVSAGGLAAVVGGFAYLFYSIMTGGKLASPGPLVAERPLIWLALQALAVATVVGTVLTCVRWRRSAPLLEKVRVGLLVAGGVVFVPWALYWGLLLP
ncbi:alpha/beta hydrolase family protein [Nonomuraea sp. NPDC050153]|uniref:alpha/beta hydrolase family protein n=1 Tax=Nonomuraea sp. NPDC050153 TaxID=3364359 RepID=UPI003789BE61